MQLLSPRNDAVFKMLFTREPRLLQSMLEAVLDVEITSLQVLNPEIPGDLSGDKSIALDVRVLLNNGTRVDVEMQVRVAPELRPRLVYYLTRDFAQQLPRGASYEGVTPTVLVVWLDQRLVPSASRFHSVFELRDQQSGELFSNHLAIHVLQMRDWSGGSSPALRQWARFLTVDSAEQLAALAMENPIMDYASKSLEQLSEDPQAARIAREREESRFFYRMGLELSRKEGREEGRNEGLQEGRNEGLQEGLLQALTHACAAIGLDITPAREAQLVASSSDELKRLLERVITTRTFG